MKITFFKNESHFYPRVSYTWENAEKVKVKLNSNKLKKYSFWICLLPLAVFTVYFLKELILHKFLFISTTVLLLPLHELCHALYCWILGRKIERICFFPYKLAPFSLTAYVKPSFNVWSKLQSILLSSFPLIILSVIPAVLAIFIPSFRILLLYICLCNISVSSYDIIDIIYFLKLPKKSLHFDGFCLSVNQEDKPIIIHQIFVTPKLDKINHKCFRYFNMKLTKMDEVYEIPRVVGLKKEFIKQFNMEL